MTAAIRVKVATAMAAFAPGDNPGLDALLLVGVVDVGEAEELEREEVSEEIEDTELAAVVEDDPCGVGVGLLADVVLFATTFKV